MKWFKHNGNARSDEKIEKLLMKYGVEGYGLYFYCVEIIAGNIATDNITFELKHDAETIAYRLKMDTLRVEEIMKWMVNEGLFQIDPTSQRLVCYGLLRRLDATMSQNPEVKKMINDPQFKKIKETISNLKQNRIEENRKEEKRIREDTMSSAGAHDGVDSFINSQKDERNTIPYKEIITLLNRECKTNYRDTTDSTRRLIKARWNEGWRLADFEFVIKSKAKEWLNNEKMVQYLRPVTLFGNKFEGYLQSAQHQNKKNICPHCKLERPQHLPSCKMVAKTRGAG